MALMPALDAGAHDEHHGRQQWHREILDKSDLADNQIAEYTGESKNIAP